MLRRLYHWTLSLAARPWAPWALGGVSFVESSVFPIPPDAMLVPMALARPRRAFFYAFITTVTSVLGGVLGYVIGALLFDTVGQWVIQLYGLEEKSVAFRALFAEHGHWTIMIAGFTPIPYKLITITAGFAAYDIWWFIALSLLTRGARFFLLAALLYQFGDWIRGFIDRHFAVLTTLVAIVAVLGFVAVRYLF
ncbi:MAG: DedA family protein [Salinarimonadaceae bacterium]|nr:MAG: DedA family protein [Salinarimonadaceae bacterium]